ncbi:ARM repeat-containing protein [Pholiota conissans]|uniref:ARM repeat-containing protein n=1 Tax=Pholiota conissans TaxID=109636 RepID=A0A9P5Z145_9AGAR|nr:ARM repeat-containing protein [Pholiota conissans]
MIHSDAQHFINTYDPNPPRSRQSSGLLGSIWAPQPQPSDTTWPRTLDSFSRVAEKESEPAARNGTLQQHIVSREDVFGPPQPPQNQRTSGREIGAIGDGRKKNSPDYGDTHVEQLLRTLNLNSPVPFGQHKPSPLTMNVDNSPNSPDFSPASVSSALLTPTDLSPTGRSFDVKLHSPYEHAHSGHPYLSHPSIIFENNSPSKNQDGAMQNFPGHRPPASHLNHARQQVLPNAGPFFEPFAEPPTPAPTSPTQIIHALSPTDLSQSIYTSAPPPPRRIESIPPMDWRLTQQSQQLPCQVQVNALPQQTSADWRQATEKHAPDFAFNVTQEPLRSSFVYQSSASQNSHEPINFLSLLHPSSSPPYHIFVSRIIKSSDQQASIFLQQKLKVADLEERAKIVDAICARGFEMMAHRFGNWAVQRCLEAASTAEERRKIVSCMRGRIVDLATNCYGCHVLQKALDCEEDIRLLIVSELLLGDPAQTLVNKHASHVWSKIMELSWTPPAPPIFTYVNKSLKGKWASLACHETGSLVVQHAFENLEADAKDGIVDELLNHGFGIFSEVTKSQWGSYCIQHILEHGSEKHRRMTLDHLLDGLLEFTTNEQGAKSVTKALKEGGVETLDLVVRRMCEPAKGARRAMIVDLALSVTGSQLIASVLPTADKDQRALLYDCIRGHIVTLRGCKTGSKVIWLL